MCGTGGVLSNAPILQDKAYFEGEFQSLFLFILSTVSVKVQSDGVWGCGVASERCDLNNVPLGESSWTFRNDLGFYSQANKIESADIELNEGDVIGVTYDHVTLQFYLNGYSVGNGTWI